MTERNLTPTPAFFGTHFARMWQMERYGVRFAPPDEGGQGGDDGKSADPDAGKSEDTQDDARSEAEKKAEGAAQRARRKADDAAKEVQRLRDELRRFEGIDPDAVKSLLEEKAEREEAAKKAEEEAARKAGDFDKIRRQMADQHSKEIAKREEALRAAQEELNAVRAERERARIESAFASSRFITESTVLTPAKAQRVYADHFEVEDGKLVAFDRPRGEAGRIRLVDSAGDELPFDQAIKRIIEADPDREMLLRAKVKSGTGSFTEKPPSKKDAPEVGQGVARIAAAFAALRQRR